MGGPSAACLWGAAAVLASTPVSVVVPRDRKVHAPPRVAVHYTTLAGSDVTTRDGLRLTTPERTVFDLGRRAGRADALVVLDALLHRHLLDPDRLRHMIRVRESWPNVSRHSETGSIFSAKRRSKSRRKSNFSAGGSSSSV